MPALSTISDNPSVTGSERGLTVDPNVFEYTCTVWNALHPGAVGGKDVVKVRWTTRATYFTVYGPRKFHNARFVAGTNSMEREPQRTPLRKPPLRNGPVKSPAFNICFRKGRDIIGDVKKDQVKLTRQTTTHEYSKTRLTLPSCVLKKRARFSVLRNTARGMR